MVVKLFSQLTFIYLKSTIESLEKGVKYVKVNKTTPELCH